MRKLGGATIGGVEPASTATGAVPPVQPTEFELLCALISGSTGHRPADVVGRELLGRFGSLTSILREPPSSLTSVRGVGRRLATRLRATGEIARRFLGAETTRPVVYLSGPEDVADLLLREMSSLDREHFRAILLNTKNRILGVRTIAIGSLNASVVHAREVFKAAVSESAQAVVLVHNHPSGIPEPSEEDIVVTERLAEAGRILGIEVLDHIILGHQGFVSLRELGHV